MKRFFLIRHGESIANTKFYTDAEEYTYDGDIPMTENGMKQVKESALFLKQYCLDNNIDLNDAILWVSPFLRTEQTADIINRELNIEKVYYDPRISELDFGLFDQRSPADCNSIDERIYSNIKTRTKSLRGKFYARFPNGESPSDVYNRISTFVETIYRDKEENIFIISHGITLRTFIMRMMHYNLEWYFKEPNAKNCSIRLIERYPLVDYGVIFTPSNQAPDMHE